MLRPLLIASLLATALPASAVLSVSKLRTEYLVNPMGIDERVPRLYWVLSSKENGQKQVAYRVRVAGSASALAAGRGDLWDSGRVESGDTIHVEYAGRPLNSRQKAWWSVQVWDEKGKATTSSPARFEMGLLNRSDWKAKWIGMPSSQFPTLDLSGAKWIWYPEGEPQKDAPPGDRWFRHRFNLPGGKLEGTISVAVDDNFEAWLNGTRLGSGGGWQAYRVLELGPALKSGENELLIKATNGHSRAGLLVVGKAMSLRQNPQMGRPDLIRQIKSNRDWEVFKEEPKGGGKGEASKELADAGGEPYGKTKHSEPATPAPYLRREVSVTKPVKSARIYASARGLYEIYVNGKRLGKSHFAPGWTDYNKRIQYQTYDVTSQVANRRSTLQMIIGDGWYCGYVAWAGRQNYGPKPMGLAQLEIEYTDGTRETVATDDTWRASYGQILSNDLLMGEHYDARISPTGWQKPDVQALTAVPLVAQRNEPSEVLDVLPAKKRTQPTPGAYVFDLGQNMVGHVRLKVRGPAGTKVQLRHAEMLNPDGTIYTTNLRAAKATDSYTLKGGGEEIWEPRFTFHGFQFVEVTGYPGVPSLDAVTGIVVGSAIPKTGTFTTSSPLVNQLQHNIFWGQRGNYLEVPTDCPQRDERLGWMGDAQIFIKTATFNNDVAAFMTKWTQDVEDAQSEEGSFADVSPRIGVGADGSPGWGDAGVIVPWTMYEVYGDKRLLSRRYASMKKWVDFIHKNNPGLIWTKRSGANYGDWLNVQDDTPRDVVATAYFAYSTDLVSRAAVVLGKSEDARRYAELHRDITRAFHKAFVGPDGLVKGNSQTAYILALNYGSNLLDTRADTGRIANTDRVLANRLVQLIRDRKDHPSTGFLGCGLIEPLLTRAGHTDLAYKLLLNESYPGWLYSVKNGATTIWERWDGWTDTKGFQDPGMNSFNHYAFGAIGEWMYQTVAGIPLTSAREVSITPTPGPGLSSASADYTSIHGQVKSSWTRMGDRVTVDVVVPPNMSAQVALPMQPDSIRTVQGTFTARGSGIVRVGSGTYRFEGNYAPPAANPVQRL